MKRCQTMRCPVCFDTLKYAAKIVNQCVTTKGCAICVTCETVCTFQTYQYEGQTRTRLVVATQAEIDERTEGILAGLSIIRQHRPQTIAVV